MKSEVQIGVTFQNQSLAEIQNTETSDDQALEQIKMTLPVMINERNK